MGKDRFDQAGMIEDCVPGLDIAQEVDQ